MNEQLIRTPVTLDRLDGENAFFTGTAEETVERQTIFGGTIELTGNYPAFFLQRTVWEDLGRPVTGTFVFEVEA